MRCQLTQTTSTDSKGWVELIKRKFKAVNPTHTNWPSASWHISVPAFGGSWTVFSSVASMCQLLQNAINSLIVTEEKHQEISRVSEQSGGKRCGRTLCSQSSSDLANPWRPRSPLSHRESRQQRIQHADSFEMYFDDLFWWFRPVKSVPCRNQLWATTERPPQRICF